MPSILADINQSVHMNVERRDGRRVFHFFFPSSLYPDFAAEFGADRIIELINMADLSWDERKDEALLLELSRAAYCRIYTPEKQLSGSCYAVFSGELEKYWEEDGYFCRRRDPARRYFAPVYLPSLSQPGSVRFAPEPDRPAQPAAPEPAWWTPDPKARERLEQSVARKAPYAPFCLRARVKKLRHAPTGEGRSKLWLDLELEESSAPILFYSVEHNRGFYTASPTSLSLEIGDSLRGMKSHLLPHTPSHAQSWLTQELRKKAERLVGETVELFCIGYVNRSHDAWMGSFYAELPDISVNGTLLSGETSSFPVQKQKSPGSRTPRPASL